MAEVTIDATAAKLTLKKVNPIKDFIAGGVGGACLVLTGHPLDTIKVSLDKQDIYFIEKFKGSITNSTKTTTRTNTFLYRNL